ncbi:PAS domain-containing sensor histidine kinase [Natronolimnohabitans innermongolicus]|uniref:histidine kinase n=1 Tax=Natronolimnohabitans innermongolicus JCM 12255 TaxID=1227499 RepID=L9WRQ3_9EURY|nr:ATP-binding protein [Natronolimnohabitans innermongolicus]ELY50983.1 multi-sensor signal transduction histidine kinase [Natronolimnohabitans innermongolicus JCM 12255]
MSSAPLTDTLQETLAIFEEGGAPRTTSEVAEQFDLGRRSAYERLERLVDHDRLETKKVGGNGRVWWRPATDERATTRDAVESEFDEVYDRISDGFYALDEEFRFRYLNDHAADVLGLDETAIGADIRDEVVLTEAFETALNGALETKEAVIFEDYYHPVDRWFHNAIYPSESGLSVYFYEITEQKRRERELTRYETIVETSPIGITIVGSDGEIQFTNDRAEEIFGRSRSRINALSFDDPRWDEVDEDGEPLSREELPFLRIVESGELLLDQVSGVLRPDGERVWISVNGAPVYDDRGEIESVVFSIEDITKRREQQRALEESERRYRTLVDHFPNGAVGLYDEDLTYDIVGGELLEDLGFNPDEVAGTTIHDRYPDELVDRMEPNFRDVFDGESSSFDIDLGDRDLLAHTLPVRNADDEIYAGMLVVQDVTERWEYQRRLEESNERLEQFAYAASHDLQEPLRMVRSYLQLIENRYGNALDEDGEEFLEYAVDGAERMRQMINGLLEYSRVDTRGDPFEPVDLNDVLDDVCEDLQMRIDESNAEITTDDLPCVDGDDGQLRRVFQNLLSNAIEYSRDEPPQVDVSATRDDDQWIISVQDNGIGIDLDEQERIFEVFQRLHTHEEHSGTGIGLALSRRIVERHGGEIWVDSEPGEGATFSFTLPAVDT